MPAHRSSTSRRRPVRARLFALVACCAPFAGAHAAVRCIDSVGQVEQEFDAALASNETVEELRIKQGNFLFDFGDIGYVGEVKGTNKTLTISGGWSGDPGQCTNRDGGPESTFFWGLGERRVLSLNGSDTFSGTIVIENMTFSGGHAAVNATASCLSLGELSGGSMAVRIDRVRVDSCTSAAGSGAPVVFVNASGGFILRNSAVTGNDSGTSAPVVVVAKAGAGWVLNNTIANNTSAQVNGATGLSAAGQNGATVRVANNLFDGNVSTVAPRIDIRIGAGVTLTNNRYTGLFGVPVANTGSSSGPAGFSGADFELSSTSTARDIGGLLVPVLQGAFDLAGKSRVRGSAVDLGALEFSPLLSDGFE